MRILLIAPKCYPVNGAEAIVNMKLLRALSKYDNIEIDLVSRKNLQVVYPSDTVESYGVKLHGLYVIENKGGFSLKVLLDSLRALVVFGSIFPGCHWAMRALPIVKKLIKENQYDFVLTKSSPSFLLGAYAKKKGQKWVASWNDPYPLTFYPIPYGKGKNHHQNFLEKLQLNLMKKADLHIFPTRALKDHMKWYLHFDEAKSLIAPHVVFEDSIENKKNEKKSNGILKIIHSGNLASPRNPRPVINALSKLLTDYPEMKLHFTFLGKMEKKDEEYMNNLAHLKDYISMVPAVEYKRSLEILDTQDIACVIEADCGVGGGVFLPTKVTDFMQSHKPMLAVSPKGGVLENLFNEGSIGYFSDINDEKSICDSLKKMYSDFTQNELRESKIPYSFTPEAIVDIYRGIPAKLN